MSTKGKALDAKLAARLRDLAGAARRLAPDQGRTARRNARVAVKKAARGVLREVDRVFPAIVKARSVKLPASWVMPKAVREARRERKLRTRGFVPLENRLGVNSLSVFERIGDLASVRIRVIKAIGKTWIPEWALLADPGDRATLKKLRYDKQYREAKFSEKALPSLVRENQ